MSLRKDSRKSSNKITWNKQKDKFVICKDSVYFALTYDQVIELSNLLAEIMIKHGE